MSGVQVPIGLWGLDSQFWSYTRLLISDIHALKDYDALPGNSYRLNGVHPIHRVCIVGVAVEVKIHATNTSIFIDDGTGIILTTSWHNGDQPCHQNCLGQLLMLAGKLSTFRGEHQINIQSIDEILDPNIEILHWVQVLELQQTVYKQVDPLVKKTLENLASKDTQMSSSHSETIRNVWDELLQLCFDLIPCGKEVLFSDMCSNPHLIALVRNRILAAGSSQHDIALAISKAVSRCVAQGLIVQRSRERDSYMRLDTNLVCQLIVDEFRASGNEPMSLTRILAAFRRRDQYACVQLQMVNESIWFLEKSSIIRRQSINTFMLI